MDAKFKNQMTEKFIVKKQYRWSSCVYLAGLPIAEVIIRI